MSASYATEADVDAAWGSSFVDVLAFDDAAAARDAVKIEAALTEAAATVNSYAGRRYRLPLTLSQDGTVLVRSITVDIAVWRIATSADRMTDIINKRYEQALATLRDIATGKADVALAPSGQTPDISPNEVVIEAAPRFFDRHRLGGY
jgi:phage gp36-like protein